MAKVYSTGPAHAFVAFTATKPGGLDAPAGVAGSFSYLGTCETAPEINLLPVWKTARSSLAGVDMPFSRIFMGLEGKIALPKLNRFNWKVYAQLAQLPFQTSTAGLSIPGDVGTLCPLEPNSGATLVIQFPYQSFDEYRDLPPGYRFLACAFEGPNNLTPGTEDLKNTLLFSAGRQYDPKTGNFVTYDFNVAGMPKPD